MITVTIKIPPVVKIDPKRWNRGGAAESFTISGDPTLYNSTHDNLCCLGFMMAQTGDLEEADLAEMPYPQDVVGRDIAEFVFPNGKRFQMDTEGLWDGCAFANDAPHIASDEDRLKAINQLTKPYGFRFELDG